MTTDHLGQKLGDADALIPPFCSAKDFPVSPKANRLLELYLACRQALVDANVARRIFKQRMAEKKKVIKAIRAEIQRVEQDFSLEADTRKKLHVMNERLLDVLIEMDNLAVDVGNTITHAQGGRRTGLKDLVNRLKLLIQRWRALRLNQSTVISKVLSAGHDDENSP